MKKNSSFFKILCNIITQIGLKAANKYGCNIQELGIAPWKYARLAQMIQDGIVNYSGAAIIFEKMVSNEVKNGQSTGFSEDNSQKCTGESGVSDKSTGNSG